MIYWNTVKSKESTAMNHVTKTRDRRITVNNPTLIKGCRNPDTITLDTDKERDGKPSPYTSAAKSIIV